MTIKCTLTKQDFIYASFAIFLSRTKFKIIMGFVFLYILIFIGSGLSALSSFQSEDIIFPIVFVIIYPGLIYYSASRNFERNSRVSETIEYLFDKDTLSIKGETFSSATTLEKIQKVTKTKNWLLIWQSGQSANAIPLKLIGADQLNELKGNLEWHKVKNNL